MDPLMNRKSTFLIYGASGEEEGFATNEFIFPIKTIGELTELERCVSQSREAYKRFNKYLLEVKVTNEIGLIEFFKTFIHDACMFSMSWDGGRGKFAMSKMLIFSKSIYEIWNSFACFDDYVVTIKKIVSNAHNRIHKRKSRLKLYQEKKNTMEYRIIE